MATNNENIMHVNAIQGLLSEVVKRLQKIEPDKSDANVFSEQTIAKENALEWLAIFQVDDIYKLQQVFE